MQLQTKTHDDKWVNVSDNFTDITHFIAYLETVRPSVKRNGRILFLGDPIDSVSEPSKNATVGDQVEF